MSCSPLRRVCLLASVLGAFSSTLGQAAAPLVDPLTVLARNSRRGEGPLRDWVRSEARTVLEQRRLEVEALKTPEQISTRQSLLRTQFIAALGGFPERTPLNARVVGQTAVDGFRIEKILFESQPGFVVTGLLYLPVGSAGPHPVALMPCGHSSSGKAGYQTPAALLARHGIAVFCFDPIGQGERRQLPVPARRDGGPPARSNPTNEHTTLSVGAILVGRNLATDMIWDGIRAIDYLETRPDLDPKRIVCVGNSGGGMMTSYLIALDDRIVAASLGCFMTTSVRKNDSPGPGDAEQNIFAQFAFGLDLPDFLLLAAPRPVQILSATRDYVPIAGAWEAFREAKRLYARFGYPERVDLVETDATHGFSIQLREGSVRWMRRWLFNDDQPVFEGEMPRLPEIDLICTPAGQVQQLPGARSVLEINRDESDRLTPLRRAAWGRLTETEKRELVRRTAMIRKADSLVPARILSVGVVPRDDLRIEKFVLVRDGDIALPALRFRHNRTSTRAALYLHGRGKHIDAAPGGPIATLVAEGVDVLAVDLRGFGETAMDGWRTTPVAVAGANGAESQIIYMLGRSLVGLRAEDVLVAARAYANLPDAVATPPELIALEEAGIPALHAAALEPEQFSSVRLVRTLDSWQRVLESVVPERQLESAVHGVLRAYDLPDLVTLAERIKLMEPVTSAGRPIVQPPSPR